MAGKKQLVQVGEYCSFEYKEDGKTDKDSCEYFWIYSSCTLGSTRFCIEICLSKTLCWKTENDQL